MQKKYLFLLNLPEQRDLAEKITDKFMQKSFCVESEPVLMMIGDKNSVNENYFAWTCRKIYCLSCNIQIVYKNQADIKSLIKDAEYFISTNAPNEKEFLKIAKKNNIKIFNAVKDFEQIFEDIPPDYKVENSKKKLLNNLQLAVFNKYPPKDHEYFLFHEGLGETTAFFFWLKKYRELYNKKILIICVDKMRKELLNFCPYVDIVVKVNPFAFDYVSVYCTEKYNIKRFLHAHFLPKVLATKSKLSHATRKNYGIIGTVKDVLDIPLEIKFEKYSINLPDSAVVKAKNLFEEMQLTQDKTVLIIPEGLFFNNLSHHMNFWIKFVEKLNAHGYEVITNSDKEIISGCRNIFLSLLETAAFAGLCGNLASVPTGFFEAICALNTTDKIRWQIFYPNENDIYWKGTKVDVDSMIEDYSYYLNQILSPNVEIFINKL